VETGYKDTSGHQLDLPYYVDLPWWLAIFLGPTLQFHSQEDAQKFADMVVTVAENARKEAFPVAMGGLLASVTYLSAKHPKEMAGVLQAVGSSIGETVKGIGEVIPG